MKFLAKNSILIIVVLFTMFSGCKKNSDDSEQVVSELIVTEKQVSPYQFLQFSFPEGIVPAGINTDIISVSIADSQISANRLTSEGTAYTYLILIPQLAEGKYKLKAETSEGKECFAELTVLPLVIADAEVVIAELTKEREDNYSILQSKYAEKVKDSIISESAASNILKFVKACNENIPKLYAGLNEVEKKKYIQLLSANKYLLDEYYNDLSANPLITPAKKSAYNDCLNLYNQAREFDRYAYMGDVIVDDENAANANEAWILYNQCKVYNDYIREIKFKSRLSVLKKAYETSSYGSEGFFAFIGTVYNTYAEGLATQREAQVNKEGTFGVQSIYDVRQKSAPSFVSGEEFEFSPGVYLVNLSREHEEYFPQFREMNSITDFYNEVMNLLGKFLPYKIALEVPESKGEVVYTSGFTIDEISDPRIKMVIRKAENRTMVTFTINETIEEKIYFRFRVNINTQYGSVSKIIENAKLEGKNSVTELKRVINLGGWKATKVLGGLGNDFSTFTDVTLTNKYAYCPHFEGCGYETRMKEYCDRKLVLGSTVLNVEDHYKLHDYSWYKDLGKCYYKEQITECKRRYTYWNLADYTPTDSSVTAEYEQSPSTRKLKFLHFDEHKIKFVIYEDISGVWDTHGPYPNTDYCNHTSLKYVGVWEWER